MSCQQHSFKNITDLRIATGVPISKNPAQADSEDFKQAAETFGRTMALYYPPGDVFSVDVYEIAAREWGDKSKWEWNVDSEQEARRQFFLHFVQGFDQERQARLVSHLYEELADKPPGTKTQIAIYLPQTHPRKSYTFYMNMMKLDEQDSYAFRRNDDDHGDNWKIGRIEDAVTDTAEWDRALRDQGHLRRDCLI